MRRYALDLEYATSLAERRRRCRASQRELALATGLTVSAIGHYETGVSGIPPYARTALERALTAAEAHQSANVHREWPMPGCQKDEGRYCDQAVPALVQEEG